jgi:hypothetical protein
VATLNTLLDLKTYIAGKRRDADFEHWDEDQTVTDINLGLQWFIDQVPLATVFGTWIPAPDAQNAAEYVPPQGFDLDEVLHLQTGGRKLSPKSPAELFAISTSWDTEVGAPIHYVPNYRRNAEEKQVVLLWPTPEATLTDLLGECTREAPWLVADDDRLILPVQYKIGAAAWALHLGYLGDKQETYDEAKAQLWRGIAMDNVHQARKKAGRGGSGEPMTVTLQR